LYKKKEVNLYKSTKEGIIQQLTCLSKRYEELLEHFDEIENPIKPQTAQKPLWITFFKKRFKKPTNNAHK
jgi:hypothetical protein